MTDIVELARERRHRLEAELAKVDDFIQMAKTLIDSEQEGEEIPEPEPEPVDLLDSLPLSDDEPIAAGYPDEDRVEAATDSLEFGGVESDQDAGTEDELPGKGDSEDDELLLTDLAPDGDDAVGLHVGMRIRHRRWMQGISQEDLARNVGATVGQIQRIETGDSQAERKLISKIAAALDVTVSYFLEGMLNETGSDEASRSNTPSKK